MASCSFQLENCTIGDLKVTMCHLTTYCKETSLTNFSDLDPDSQMLIALLTQLNSATIINVCAHHLSAFLTQYSRLQKACVNCFGVHKKLFLLPQGKVY